MPNASKPWRREVAEVAATGVQIGVVVAAATIFRGVAAAARNMDRVTGDHMGMLATVINALALPDALEQMGIPTRVMSASRCTRWPSPTSAAAPSATWKRAAS